MCISGNELSADNQISRELSADYRRLSDLGGVWTTQFCSTTRALNPTECLQAVPE